MHINHGRIETLRVASLLSVACLAFVYQLRQGRSLGFLGQHAIPWVEDSSQPQEITLKFAHFNFPKGYSLVTGITTGMAIAVPEFDVPTFASVRPFLIIIFTYRPKLWFCVVHCVLC